VNYGGTEGIDLGSYALIPLDEQRPELLCPSHGEPLNDPGDGIRETRRKLVDYVKFQGGVASVENRPFAVSPHLVANFQTTSSFYAIVSNSGKAMFIDYGSASTIHFNNFQVATAPTQRMRFVEHTIGDLKRDFGVNSVDVAMPSHMHDDHMNGFPQSQAPPRGEYLVPREHGGHLRESPGPQSRLHPITTGSQKNILM
jgi:hypothetical protein